MAFVPQNLLNFTSPVVSQALKTGARGSTVKTTNYGVIGDAFFKKAQLELGIANLQADIGLRSAQIQSNLEMNKAQLNLSKAQMLLDYDLKAKENDVGFFEGLFGTIAGAAQGAATGAAMGGPQGAIIGGAIGGVATGVGYAAEGRKGGVAARQMIGTVSNAAIAIKGFNDEAKAKDGWKGLMEAGADIMANMNRPGQTPEQMQQNQADWADHLSQVNSFQTTDLGMNPQQAVQATKGYAGLMQGYDAADPESRSQADMVKRSMEFAAVENPTRDDFKQFWADQSVNYHRASGGKDMSEQYFQGMVEQAHPGLMSTMQPTATQPGARTQQMNRQRIAQDPAFNPPTPETPSVGDLRQAPQRGRPAQQGSAQPGTAGVPTLGASSAGPVGTNWRQPQISGGVQMDDGGQITEQDILKQGAETVEALKKSGEGEARAIEEGMEEESIGDKVSKILPFKATRTDKANRNVDRQARALDARNKTEDNVDEAEDRTQKLLELKRQAKYQAQEGPERTAQLEQERAIRYPGVKEDRAAERQELEKRAPVIDAMPEKDVAQRNTKKGLRDAVYASGHLDELMEKIPDNLYTRFSQFVKEEGIGVKSPHVSVEALDEVAKALVEEEAEGVFTDSERKLLTEWAIESRNLMYADALMDAGSRGVSSDAMKIAKANMPSWGDSYDERSHKLKILMRGYGERITDQSNSTNNEAEQLDLQSKRMRNQKQLQGLSKPSGKVQNGWWLDITGAR